MIILSYIDSFIFIRIIRDTTIFQMSDLINCHIVKIVLKFHNLYCNEKIQKLTVTLLSALMGLYFFSTL